MSSENLLWCDTETTGLVPDKDHLLELAFVVTDSELTVLWQGSWLWLPLLKPVEELYAAVDPFVQKMHTENGLWAELYQAQQGGAPSRPTASQLTEWLLPELSKFGFSAQSKTAICGRNPKFDLGFLQNNSKALADLFDYHALDVCGFQARARQRFGAAAKFERLETRTKHRALEDCLSAVDELRFYEGLG